jgi:glycosyltransferase involved in cell wall biosynthesis
MIKQNSFRPVISRVPEGTSRPLWSVMIPTYNCADYLHETLLSVLAQDPGEKIMQIEVIDDYSTLDNPAEVVKKIAGDRVAFFRQGKNVGHIKNFYTCLTRSRGDLIHILHGDDLVFYGYYSILQEAFHKTPKIGAAFCRHFFINEQGEKTGVSEILKEKGGILENWLERIITKQYIQTPSITIRRNVFEKLGSFDQRFKYYYEDWEMWVRIATEYPFWFEPKPLAAYRLRSASNSGNSMRSGESLNDIQTGHKIVKSYLTEYIPLKKVNRFLLKNQKHSAKCALNAARNFFEIGDSKAGIAQIRGALKIRPSIKTAINGLFLLSYYLLLNNRN